MTHPLTDLLPTAFRHKLRTGRDLVRARRRAVEDQRLATGCEPLDLLLGGGLMRGHLMELVAWGSSGRFAMVLSALAGTTRGGEAAALIDLGDSLSPEGADQAGIVLERLLWVRPRTMKEALMATESVISCGMPLVVFDLGIPPIPGGRGVEAFWLRLVRAAESRRSAVFVASPYRVSGTAAHWVIEADERRAQWQGSSLEPKLLHRLSSRLRIMRSPTHGSMAPQALALHTQSSVASKSLALPEAPETSNLKPVVGRSGPKKPVTGSTGTRPSDPEDALLTSNPSRAIA